MNYDLRDYVRVYENVLSKEFCDETVKQLQSVKWQPHAFYDSAKRQLFTHEHDLSLSYEDIPNKQSMNDLVGKMLQFYVYGDNWTIPKWFEGCSDWSRVRFNRYLPQTLMKNHCDHIQSLFDGERKGVPILSVLGALNDDYEGGELIFWETQEVELKAGSIMVFPSNFLYPHKVSPVKSGVRYSYVSWGW